MIPKNLALLFPDWNSLDSVRNAHSLLELWAIWLFAALVVCDIVAHLVEDNRKTLAKIFERIGLCCFALAVAAELSAYKYGQRNDELSAGVIKSLSTEAAEALTKAAKAITDSGIAVGQANDAETESGNALGVANKANVVAGDAQGKADAAIQDEAKIRSVLKKATDDIGVAESEASDAKAKNLATERTLEQERNTRLELEKSIAPRVLYIKTYGDGTSNIDNLKKLAGTVVLIRYVPDFEAERAARFIAFVLNQSGWKILGVEETKDVGFDGVRVERYHPNLASTVAGTPERDKQRKDANDSIHVCESVLAFLEDNNWVADLSFADGIPPKSVRITVDFKPNPYFDPFNAIKKQFESTRNNEVQIKKPTAPLIRIEGVLPWFPPPPKP